MKVAVGAVLSLWAVSALAEGPRLVLRWKEVPQASAYELQIARDAEFKDVVLQTRTPTAGYRWDQLPESLHWWRVRALDAEGRAGEWSAPRTVVLDSALPVLTTPQDGAQVVCGGPLEVALEGKTVIREYELSVSAVGGFDASRELHATTPAFQVTGLAAGDWVVKARGVDLQGKPSEWTTARTVHVRPLAPRPRALAEVSLGSASEVLAWSETACATGYLVEGSTGGHEHFSRTVTGTSLPFHPSVVGELRWKVAARDASGHPGPFSAEQVVRVRLATPAGLKETLKGEALDFAWVPVAQAASYRFEVVEPESRTGLVSGTPPGAAFHLAHAPTRPVLWRVTARDGEGHLSAPCEWRRWAPPATLLAAVELTSPDEGAQLPEGEPVQVCWAAGVSQVELQVDGAAAVTAQGRCTSLPLAPGVHQLEVSVSGGPRTTRHFRVGPAPVARIRCAQAGLEAQVLAYDADGAELPSAPVRLSVQRGTLGPLERRGALFVAGWAPPATGDDVLEVTAGAFTGTCPLVAPHELLATFALRLGGQFNGGAVASPEGVLSATWRLPLWQRQLGLELRVGLYRAATSQTVAGVPASGEAWLLPLTLAAVWHQPLGAFVLRAGLGPTVQSAFVQVQGAHTVAALPGAEAMLGLGRALGPGRLEVEVGGLFGHLSSSAATLIAGGGAVRVGYAFDVEATR